jgi:hypothetical protein
MDREAADVGQGDRGLRLHPAGKVYASARRPLLAFHLPRGPPMQVRIQGIRICSLS